MNFFSTFLLKCLEVIKKAVSLQRFREIRHTKFTEVMKGRLAQLARAPALHAGGQRFESVILHSVLIIVL